MPRPSFLMPLQEEIHNAVKKLILQKVNNNEITVKEFARRLGVRPVSIYVKLEDYNLFGLKELEAVIELWGSEINQFLKSIVIIKQPLVLTDEQINELNKALNQK